MDQASATPFGGGKGYNMLHGPEREQVMKDILNGDLKWNDPVTEVNKWVANLRTVYDPVALEIEVAKLAGDIIVVEFQKFF